MLLHVSKQKLLCKFTHFQERCGRIGKSTIVEEFAKREYRSYILIDFNRAPSAVVKLFVAGTGLPVTMALRDKYFAENIIYQKLLSDKLDVNLGYIYVNLTTQMLAAVGNRLFYYTFPKDDKHRYEVDFLISRGNKLCPIEVKSSGYKTHASLDVFCTKYSNRISKRFVVYTKDIGHEGDIEYISCYMLPFL